MRFHRLKRTDGNTWTRHVVGDRLRLCSNVMTTEATVTDIDAKRRITLVLDRPLCIDEGERVAILRHHGGAGRELLEGMAEICSVTPWPHQVAPEGSAVAPNRTVVWEPLERPVFERAVTPSYEDLLSVILGHKEDDSAAATSADARIRLPEPAIERVPKQTVWLNWPATVAELDRTNRDSITQFGDHFRAWLERDMSTTTHQNAEGAMFVRGIWRVDDLQMVLRRYVAGHKRCPQCGGHNTQLRTERTIKGWCVRCKTDYPLAS